MVLLIGFCEDPVSIVMEYLEQGSLHEYLRSHSKQEVSFVSKKEVLFGVARGMLHLHKENIIHRLAQAKKSVQFTKTLNYNVI